MNKENIPVERQIRNLIKSTNCTFKLRGKKLDVVNINSISILNHSNGDFGEWNTKYNGYAQLEVNNGIPNCTLQSNYNIEGYAKTEGDTVVDIDKIISATLR